MFSLFCPSLFCFILLFAPLAQPALGEESSEADKVLREKWQGVYQEIAQSLEMSRGETKLALEGTPLLFYSNPVRATDQHGTLFLWTEEGRPAVLGSIWSAVNRLDTSLRNITHEFHSLSEDKQIQAARAGQAQWTSGEPGIEWQTLLDAPVPAATRTARLLQMRTLARRLTARITAEEESELRLMTQPLYRYPEKASLDGAVFVYALATDPELVLVLEGSAEDSKSPWRAAFARFGNLKMAVEDGKRTLWTCERGTPGRSEGKYYLRWRIEQRPANLEQTASAP